MATEAASEAAAQALEKATAIPAKLSKPILRFGIKKAAKVAAALLAVFATLVALVFFSVTGALNSFGASSIFAPQPTATIAAEIPQEYLQAYEHAARRYHIPWTVLAGLGQVLTHQGRTAPTDVADYGQLLDRDPSLGSATLVATPSPAASGASQPVIASLGASATGGAGEAAVVTAEQYLGVPYVPGGATPQGFDCSGLVQYVYGLLGYNLPRTSEEQQLVGEPIPKGQWQPGDLLFYGNPAGHVTIYAGVVNGNPMMIEAPHPGAVVRMVPVYPAAEPGEYLQPVARRIITAAPAGAAVAPPGSSFVGNSPGAPAAGPSSAGAPASGTAASSAAVLAAAPLGTLESAAGFHPGTLGATSPSYRPYKCVDGECGPWPVMGRSPDEPQGPFQLKPKVVADAHIDGNDLYASVHLVARHMAHLRNEMVAASPGLYGHWRSSNRQADALWSAVVNRLGTIIAVPGQDTTGASCSQVQPGLPVAAMVQIIWQCEIRNASALHVVASESVHHGALQFQVYDRSMAATTLISEALQVSHAYSDWGSASCTNTAQLAGVFPLSRAVASRYGDTNRCNQALNIDAAARAVLATETTRPSQRSRSAGTFAPMLGGWLAMPAVFGTELPALLSNGPFVPWTPSLSCNDAIDVWLRQTASQPHNPFASVTPANVRTRAAVLGADLVRMAGDPRQSPVCGTSSGRPPGQQAWWRTVATRAAGLAVGAALVTPPGSPAPRGGTGAPTSAPDPGAALHGLQLYLTARTSGQPGPFVWGQSSAVSRLSLTGTGAPYSNTSAAAAMPGLSIGGAVVEDALAFGGDHPGDHRRGSVSAVLTTASAAAMVQLAAQATPTTATWKAPSLVAFSRCGSPANTSYSASQALVANFAQLCQAATLAGVQLDITTAARSNTEEAAAYAASPATEFAPASSAGNGSWKGSDPFEEGTAVRLAGTASATAWLQEVTGCYSSTANQYTPFASPESPARYVSGRAPTCANGQLPVKRAQTYGFVPECVGPGETAATPAAVTCEGTMADGFVRQPDLLLLGQMLSANGPNLASAVGTGVLPPNAQPAYQFFLAQGFSPAQAAGIVGNLVVESGVDPEKLQGGADWPSTVSNGPGRGIAQWSVGGRWQPSLMTGNPQVDFQNQLAYIMQELHGAFASVVPAMKATATPQAAALVWQHQYEIGEGSAQREADAQLVYNAAMTVWASAPGQTAPPIVSTPTSGPTSGP